MNGKRDGVNYFQLSPQICVPERTYELSLRQPGVIRVLEMGISVRQYLDSRLGLEVIFGQSNELEQSLPPGAKGKL